MGEKERFLTGSMFKQFPNISGMVFIVLSAAIVLLTGWVHPVRGQTEGSATVDPPEATSKTTNENLKGHSAGSANPPHLFIEKPVASGETGKWVELYEKLAHGTNKESSDYEDANKFYQELNAALRDVRNRLRDVLTAPASTHAQQGKVIDKKESSGPSGKTPGQHESQEAILPEQEAESRAQRLQIAKQLHSELNVLYNLRIRVLKEVSPVFRSRITGAGAEGIQALKEELDYILLTFRYHLYVLPKIGRRAVNGMLSAPVPVLLAIIKLAVSFFVFLLWRRWALHGIPKLRNNILDSSPRTSINIRLAKFFWYLNRVRRPLEWGLLVLVWVNIIDKSEGQVIQGFLLGKAKWILMAWFAVALVDAMTLKSATASRSKAASVRIRSTWLFAMWVVVVAIGLGITEDLAGKGTIYEWVRNFSKLLAIPVLVLLIFWWRPEIYRRLEKDSQQPAYIQKILQYQHGLRSYFGAALGAAYLIVNNFRQWILRGITAFEVGRSLVANLTRIEAMRVSERQRQKSQGNPISEEMRHQLFIDNGKLVESVGASTLERMVHLVEQRRRGTAAIVAERGGGKTQLLKRLDSQLEDKAVLFSCPIGGFSAFQKVFAQSLDLNVSDLTPETISERLQKTQTRVIGIDNLDRLSRPALGGQQDMDQLAALVRSLQVNVFWFFGVDWAAWQYITSVRAGNLFLDDVLHLQPWTEEQITMLVESRSSHAGINPDFGELSLPRQFEDINYETIEERNRFGFYRILWNASDGNPVVALQLWADSLRVAPDGRIIVSLPQLPATSELENIQITVLLTLRVIAQSGMANQEEIITSLRFPATEIAGALRLAIDREWIESVNGSYRLTWKWFRSITRILARQNLLVRRTLGG